MITTISQQNPPGVTYLSRCNNTNLDAIFHASPENYSRLVGAVVLSR